MHREDIHRPELIEDCGYRDLNPITAGYSKIVPPSGKCKFSLRERWLLHYVLGGEGILEIKGKIHPVRAGQIFVIPPYVPARYEPIDTNPWEYVWISFTAGIELPEIMSQPVIPCPEARDIFEDIRHCGKYDSGKNAYLASCLWRLMSVFMEKGSGKMEYVDKALSFIHTQYNTDISVAMIADSLNIDRRYFSAIFKKQVGSPPGNYIKEYRLAKAAELMTVYGTKPAVAAASVGINDIFYFSKSFKKHFGLSPREYVTRFKQQTIDFQK